MSHTYSRMCIAEYHDLVPPSLPLHSEAEDIAQDKDDAGAGRTIQLWCRKLNSADIRFGRTGSTTPVCGGCSIRSAGQRVMRDERALC